MTTAMRATRRPVVSRPAPVSDERADQAREESAVDLLTRVVRSYFHHATQVSFTLRDVTVTAGHTLYDRDEQERQRKRDNERIALEQHKLVRAAVDNLGARIHAVKLRDGD